MCYTVLECDEFDDKVVAEVGVAHQIGPTSSVVAVRFRDGTYGIIALDDDIGPCLLQSKNEEVRRAIERSICMPAVGRTLDGENIAGVRGTDSEGSFFAKLFYNGAFEDSKHDVLRRI